MPVRRLTWRNSWNTALQVYLESITFAENTNSYDTINDRIRQGYIRI